MAAVMSSSAASALASTAVRANRAPVVAAAARLAPSSTATVSVSGHLGAKSAGFMGRATVKAAALNASTSRKTSSIAAAVVASSEAPVAIVTGASRGIGAAIALELAKQGCRLVVNHSSPNVPEDTLAACKAAGAPEVIAVQADVSSKADVDAMIKTTMDTYGRIDILVNNAGITKDTLVMRMKPEMWQSVIDVNLTGVFYCAQAASKVMSKQRSGRIINIASVVGQMGNAGQANYSAAKGGVIAMTKTFAREFSSRGICINAVAPGFIKSDMTAAIDPKYEGAILAQIPLGRMGEAEEVAGLVRYLACDSSAAYITGHTFNVDGGMAM